MPIKSIAELQKRFRYFGADTIYIKHLAERQDNDKNQIYLGNGLDGVTNLFPATIHERSPSESHLKRKSDAGRPKLEARLDFAWIGTDGTLWPAPGTGIIDYFQYPEVRLSGFLKGCKSPPDALRRTRQALYGKRILALAVIPSGTVLGMVLTETDDPVVEEFPDLPELPSAPFFRVLVIGAPAGAKPLDLLKADLKRIFGGWHPSMILKTTSPDPEPFSGNQGAGYTLEALLGVPANAKKAPDKYGFEVKSFSSNRISLMTPTPDGGFQGAHTFREFMDHYGHPGTKGDDSRRFTGTHRCGQICKATGMSLRVTGYDPAADSFDDDTASVGVELFHVLTGDVVAAWSLERLANSWNEKHASAIYVPSKARASSAGSGAYREYSYGPVAHVGQGTTVWRLLRAVHAGVVYYDPADSIYANGEAKVRSQWRINGGTLKAAMALLYKSTEEIRP